MTSNPPESDNSTPKIKQEGGEKVESKLKFNFPKKSPLNSGPASTTRSTSAGDDFFIGDCSSSKLNPLMTMPPLRQAPLGPSFLSPPSGMEFPMPRPLLLPAHTLTKKKKKKKKKKNSQKYGILVKTNVPSGRVYLVTPTDDPEKPQVVPASPSPQDQTPQKWHPMRSNLIAVSTRNKWSYEPEIQKAVPELQTESPMAGKMGVSESPMAGKMGISDSSMVRKMGVSESPMAGKMGVSESPVAGNMGVSESQMAGKMGVSESPMVGKMGVSESPIAGKMDFSEPPVAGKMRFPGVAAKHRYFPAGIPRSFLLHEKVNAIMQQNLNATAMNANSPLAYNMEPEKQAKEEIAVQPQEIPQPRVFTPTVAMENIYDIGNEEDLKGDERNEVYSPDFTEISGNRVSAFDRLGPISQPKKPKLTINLLFSKDQPVREVLDEAKEKTIEATTKNDSPEAYTPVHERRELLLSTDELVIKYLSIWPWKKQHFTVSVARFRERKDVMLQEFKTMAEVYSKPDNWVHVRIRGYPEEFDKNDVLDALFENLRNEHFIPCFIEKTPKECNFLVLTKGTQQAFTSLHNMRLTFIKNNYVITITLLWHALRLSNIDFHPRLILARRLLLAYNSNTNMLNLSNFCLQPDISHFIYFPLNRVANQYELMEMPASISWTNLQELNLSHNRLKSIEGFQFHLKTPNLRVLDLSHNYLEILTDLIRCHGMPLHSLKLEGNPVCTDFTDPEYYIKVARMLFPCLKYLDDVPLRRRGEIPPTVRHYCPEDAKALVDSFLGLFFPLLDAQPDERLALEEMYDSDAMWSMTFPSRMRLNSVYRRYKNIFSRSRNIEDGNTDHLRTCKAIAQHLATWPAVQHDHYSFNVDVLYHTDNKTVLKISGLMKVLVESMMEEEPLLGFVRTLILGTDDGVRYRIQNEMVSWGLPSPEMTRAAFKQAPVQTKKISLKLDHPPNDELKKKFVELFMKVSDLDSSQSQRCLEMKNWNFKDALEYFMEILKLNEIKVSSEQ